MIWRNDTDTQPISLPAGKAGGRWLTRLFVVFRVLLFVVAAIAIVRVSGQIQTKQWFENNIWALSFLDRSLAESRRAKADLFDYAMGGPPQKLSQAKNRLNAVQGWLDAAHGRVEADPAIYEKLDAAKSGVENDLMVPLKLAENLPADASRKQLSKDLLASTDQLLRPFVELHWIGVKGLMGAGDKFRENLQQTGLGPIFILLSTYLLVLGGLTRAYVKERRRNEEALKQSEEDVKFLLDNMYDGLIVIDENAQIESASHRGVTMLGYEIETDLLNKSLSGVLDEDVSKLILSVSENSFSVVRECRATKSDGSKFFVELSLRSVPTAVGERYLGTIRDITGKKDAEQWKREMVAVVSHDLRTPLTSISASLELAQTGALGHVPPAIRAHVSSANGKTGQLIQVINKLLDLEKLENSDPSGLEVMALDGANLVSEALSPSLKELAAKKQIVMETSIEPGLAVVGDQMRLAQLIAELAQNAINFSTPDSSVQISLAGANDWAELRVTDRGRGIPTDKQQLIFQRLEQVQPDDRLNGSGLGLALCRAIVDQHGGALSVQSDVGKGSTFTVLLKRALRTQDSAIPVRVEAPVAVPVRSL